MKNILKSDRGFNLIELVISIAIFAILVAGMLATYATLSQSVKIAREKTIINSLATNYLEIAKNMPYSQLGTISGNPHGELADYTNALSIKIESSNYKIYYEVTYIDDPSDGTAPADPFPADYKQVKMNIQSVDTGKVTSFVTDIMPKGLEGMENGGALKVLVINSVGEPVPGANIHITSPTTTPTMVLDRTSGANGQWIEVGLPPRVSNYRIVVTKSGYSTDQTYPATPANPNPTKPDATIAVGLVTQVTFMIDALSTLNIRTLNKFCQNISGVNVNVRGAKLIGIVPNVYKFNNNYTSSAGLIVLNDLEWDTYTPTMLSGQPYVVRGTSQIQKIDVFPGTTQTFTIILGTNTTANSLLVIVKDAATRTPLEGAIVHLRKGGSVPQDYYGSTGGSVWVQDSWKGGPGVANWSPTSTTRYYTDDGNVDANSNPTGLRLKKVSSKYVLSGWAESSVFDTGTSTLTNFTTLTWNPTSQDADTVLKFQIASSDNISGPWIYYGPDGTAGTYYAIPGASISTVHDNNRYVRYKAYLSTADKRKTPVLTSLNVNYVSGCYTPGQVWFPDLTSGNNYDLDVSMEGFQTQTVYSLDINGNQNIEILMSP